VRNLQRFCGGEEFCTGAPCDSSELVYFRQRIGEAEMELIFKESIRVNGDDAKEDHVIADTTVQEKNITFPTDAKLHRKIIGKCRDIAESGSIPLRQTHTHTRAGSGPSASKISPTRGATAATPNAGRRRAKRTSASRPSPAPAADLPHARARA
jgi:hypothetical protein